MVSVNRHLRYEENFLGWLKRSGIKKGTFSLNKRLKPSPDSKKITESNNHNSSLLSTWAESFIFAGSSALLLLLASLFPACWYFSFFAFIPFLYRIIQTTPAESLRLGFLFGISFFTVSQIDSFLISPFVYLLKLLFGTSLFTLFSWSIGWAKKRWGFNPFIVSVLWIFIQTGLLKLGLVGGLIEKAGLSHPVLHCLVGLIGFLAVSALIVFFNSLLVLAVIESLKLVKSIIKIEPKEKRKWNFVSAVSFFTQKVYAMPKDRAPPLQGILF